MDRDGQVTEKSAVEQTSILHGNLRSCEVFDVTEVVPKYTNELLFEGLIVVPPFNDTWFEWDGNVGIHVTRTKPADYLSIGVEEQIKKIINNISTAEVLLLSFYTKDLNGFCMIGVGVVAIDKGGIFVTGGIVPGVSLRELLNNTNDILNEFLISTSQAVLHCLSLINCSNVEITTTKPPAKLQKKRKKRKKSALVSVHTIKINPVSKRSEPSGNETDRTQARHKVRGHVKRYKGKGLFGKYRGQWYWPAHMSGDAKNGITVTDYKVIGEDDEEE